MNKKEATLCFITIVLMTALPISAEVKPAIFFQNHAVLQAGRPLPVWGQADVGEKVTVDFAGQSVSATTAADGSWKVVLAPLKVSADPAILTIRGKNSIELNDILVGEVWLCSGQSNMAFALPIARDGASEVAAANHPTIRQLIVRNNTANTPQTTVRSQWDVCTPQNAIYFTAVGYFFAREVQKELGVPIGIINITWGGTDIEVWMTGDSIAKNQDLNFVATQWQKKLDNYPVLKAEWEAREVAATKAEAEAIAKGLPYKKKWNPEPAKPDGSPHYTKPSALFNGMVAPLAPAALAGVLWYQGENNIGRADQYRFLFPSLITGWRAVFGQPNLPFYWVQLPNFNGFGPGEIAKLREAQASALSLPATGQVITIDLGESANIHPVNKQDVGHRLALLVLKKSYRKERVASAPVFSNAQFTNGTGTISFTGTEDSLTIKGETLNGFELAGSDRNFQPAEARLEGQKVFVSSASVPAPVAVRYAWTNDPKASLFGQSGLPVAPFRSDSW